MRLARPISLRWLIVALPVASLAVGVVNSQAATKTKLSGTITVDAASSLTHAFTQIAAKFHKLYPQTRVIFNFGSSTTLANQIIAGAPTDLFASADLTDMDSTVSAGFVHVAPKIFVRNTLEIAVKPGNPLHITGLSSLPSAGVIALCSATAPCGIYAANALRRAGVTLSSSNIDRQANSTSTVLQVAYGDVGAAVVYVTDVNGQGSLVSAVRIPATQNVIADYPIAPLAESQNPRLAAAFLKFVTSKDGQRSLRAAGFLAP